MNRADVYIGGSLLAKSDAVVGVSSDHHVTLGRWFWTNRHDIMRVLEGRATVIEPPDRSTQIFTGEIITLRDRRLRVIGRADRNRFAVRNADTERLSYIPEWRLLKAKQAMVEKAGR